VSDPRLVVVRAAAVALLLALAWPREARAGGFTITAVGGRRTSSLANIAKPDDLTALVHNPAGLADQKGFRLHISNSFFFAQTDFKMKALDPTLYPEITPAEWPLDADGYYATPIKPERYFGVVPYLGASSDLGFLGKGGEDFVASLALYFPGFYGATLPANAPTAYSMIDGMFMVGTATAGVGWRVDRVLAIGASASVNYMRLATRRKISVIDALTPEGEIPSQTAVLGQGLLGDITLDYAGQDWGGSGGASLLLTPSRWFAFGFNYMGSSSANFQGDVKLTSNDTATLERMFYALKYKMPKTLAVAMAIPHTLQWGINVSPWPWLEWGFDVRTWFYQFYRRQAVIPGYDPNEAGAEPLTAKDLSSEKNYRLSYEVATGVLVRPWKNHPKIELMGGVSYDQTPIPDATFSLDNPSLSSVNYAVGVRFPIGEKLRATLTYLQYSYVERNVTNSRTNPPTNGRGSGVARLPTFELEWMF